MNKGPNYLWHIDGYDKLKPPPPLPPDDDNDGMITDTSPPLSLPSPSNAPPTSPISPDPVPVALWLC